MSAFATSARRTCLVVPCYNEAKRLDLETFRCWIAREESVRLLFVDDGSTDATLPRLHEVQSGSQAAVSILPLERNGGKAEAVRRGIVYALENFDPDFVGFWDADLATPLDAAGEFLAIMAARPEIEMVFGSRVKLLGRYVERRPIRHYLGRVFATVVSNLLGLAIYDTQCGAKIFRVTPALRRIFEQPFLSKWVFDVEILARFVQANRGDTAKLEKIIYEHPLVKWVDVAGSKVKPSDFFVAFLDLLRIRSRYL